MEDFKINGYKIHVSIKIPHLYETLPTYSYQFLIFNKKGKLVNYPFSVIIAYDDYMFKTELKKNFEKFVNYTKVKAIHAYPMSKFLESIS
ncbi:MAG: hypothetical protein ACFFD2_25420 [Promethearchaeota archaeon]